LGNAEGVRIDNGPGFLDPLPYIGPTVTVVDSMFVGNMSSVALIQNFSAHPLIDRCTLAFNDFEHPFGFGSAIRNSNGAIPTIRNTILWGNSSNGIMNEDAQVFNFSDGAAFITNSVVQGYTGKLLGVDCIADDPLFQNLAGFDGLLGTADDDIRLMPSSPCVDQGYPSNPGAEIDLLGFPRELDGDLDGLARVDMGASEFSHVALQAVVQVDAGTSASSLFVEVQGPRSMLAQLFVASTPGFFPLPPYGAFLFDPQGGWMRFPLGVLPESFEVNVTPLVGVMGPVVLQAFGFQRGAGNLSNAVIVDLSQATPGVSP
jgi:hypothetical protein